MQPKGVRFFLSSAAGLLAITALAKIISGFGHARILDHNDPILDVSYRTLFFGVGAAELATALICFCSRQIWLRAGLLAWLATGFLVYRLGLLWGGYLQPCKCLGSLTEALHLPPETADAAMKVVLGYLLAGSYATLIWAGWWQRRMPTTAPVSETPASAV